MGANLCGLRNAPSHDGSESNNHDQDKQKNPCGFMNPRSLSAAMKMRKTVSHGREKKLGLQLQVCKNTSSSKALTLEDLIKTSPGFIKSCDSTDSAGVNYGESDNSAASNCKQSSRRIHPSFDGDDELATHGNGQLESSSSFSKINKSSKRLKKKKKKVSFRSPEVADVFVMGSPVMYVSA